MQAPTVAAERQQGEVWPLQAHPPGQLHLGQVQSLDAFVASMELQPADSVNLGFMCGSLPVPTCSPSDIGSCNSSSSANNGDSEAALIPAFGLQSQRAAAPRYRVLPTETDLNMPPTDSFQADPIFPVSATQEAAGSCKAWAGSYLSQPLARKCEALAVNALAGYGDEIDVVAPVDILKQLFKIPYCKARLSLAVHRIGHTLILNSGPDQWRDDRPGVKLPSQKKSHAQMMERALFSKFVQHSMNGDSCGSTSPPDSDSQSSTSTFGFEEFDDHELQQRSRSRMASHRKGKTRVSLGHYRHNRCEARFETVQKKRYAGEQQRETEFVQKECPADGPQRPHDNYLRVLFWQFENLRMLLGSDLLLFSNENHSAVSLHLLEIERQVTPLMWLDAWLDNVMASIPELAVCYHRNGVVQGYELLKTDDIFLVKGLAEDGSTVFHPHVIQKNASTVLRFLQDNCKQDPGTYWLLKNSGEDLMQLFDLSVISKTCSPHTDKDEKSDGTLPSTRTGCREQYSLPLAMLLYRLTHRLSLSQDPADSLKCAKLFGKCLEFMEEQEHLIIRASAHEHMARLILTSFKKIGSILAPLLLESSTTEGAVVTETKQPVLKLHSSVEEAARDDIISATSQIQPSHGREISTTCSTVSINPCTNGETTSLESTMAESKVEDNGSLLQKSLESRASEPEELSVEQALESSSGFQEVYNPNSVVDNNKALGFVAPADTPPKALLALTDPVSARLAAVHHISQAIKALRWQRQLDIGEHPIGSDSTPPKHPSHGQQFPLCICGEAECVAICDFREIAAGAQMDQKLWRLMLLLGEGYLSLGEAYKDQGQLNRAMKAAELACLVCGAMPPGSENTTDDSLPENNSPAYQKTLEARSSSGKACELKDVDGSSVNRSVRKARGRQQGLFWGRVWMFVGDVYVEIQRSVGEGDVTSHKQGSPFEELTMPREVMKEVKRLKKKIGQLRGSCGMCSLTSCSCQSDRASSGESASSCNSSIVNSKYGRRVNKTGNSKSQHKVSGDLVSESKSNVGENWGRSAREHSDSGRDTKREDREKVNGAPHGLVKSGTTAAKLLTAQSKTEKVLKLKGNVGESGRRSEKEPSDSGRDIDKEARNGLAASGNTAAKLLTAQPKVENVQGKGHSDPSDIFSYLRRPMTVDWESNLSAAGECYAMAIMAFGGFSECSQHLESALRKKGWAYNELGRRRLSHGLAKLAEVAFATAVEAFRAVKDAVNVVLVHCNLGHGKRAAAEALAAKLSAWRDCDFLPLYVQTIAEAKFLYGEALKFYGMARLELLGAEDDVRASMGELLGAEDDVRASMRGLWTEVHTQLAHTYLRLGMLLAKEDNIVYACRKSNAERRLLGNGGGGDKMLSGVKDATPTKDAITKALELYKSMGDLRAQEAAFAQFQLACHHRDSCQSAALQGDVVLKKAETSSFQKAKLHLSLAELYWQKALEFYQPEPHVDMFLDILVERSALCFVMATSFHQNQMTEQALNFLLEGRRAFVSDAIDCPAEKTQARNAEKHHAKPSAETVEKLTKQLQMLLKTMLAAAVQSSRLSSNAGNLPRGQKSNGSVVQGDMQSGRPRPDDVEKLKQMYRVALQSAREPNLDLLFNLWVR